MRVSGRERRNYEFNWSGLTLRRHFDQDSIHIDVHTCSIPCEETQHTARTLLISDT